MKVNIVVIAIVVIAVLAFFYFIIRRNRKDQKNLERELNQKELSPDKHDEEKV